MFPLDPSSASYSAWLINPANGETNALVAAGDDPTLVTQLAGIAFAKLDQPVLVGVRDKDGWLATIGYLGLPETPDASTLPSETVTTEIPPSVEDGPAD